MLHTTGVFMPSYSFKQLREGDEGMFDKGPVSINRGDALSFIAMSDAYGLALANYIESLAIEPLIHERGDLPAARLLNPGEDESSYVKGVEMVLTDWDVHHPNTRTPVLTAAVGKIGSTTGLRPVINRPRYGYARVDYRKLRGGNGSTVISTYYVFRKDDNRETVLIGILAGKRKGGVFDPMSTGAFFTPDALSTMLEWERGKTTRYGTDAIVA